jgi:hypothetical protein
MDSTRNPQAGYLQRTQMDLNGVGIVPTERAEGHQREICPGRRGSFCGRGVK